MKIPIDYIHYTSIISRIFALNNSNGFTTYYYVSNTIIFNNKFQISIEHHEDTIIFIMKFQFLLFIFKIFKYFFYFDHLFLNIKVLYHLPWIFFKWIENSNGWFLIYSWRQMKNKLQRWQTSVTIVKDGPDLMCLLCKY